MKCSGPASLVQCASMKLGASFGAFGVGDGSAVAVPETATLHCNARVSCAPCALANVSKMPPGGQAGCCAITGNETLPPSATFGYDAVPVAYPELLRKIANGGAP